MAKAQEENENELLKTLASVREIPERVLETYARLWQLEIWLRQMVYVELRAAFGDGWKEQVNSTQAGKSQQADDELTYMPTPEEDLLSYTTFGGLCTTIEKHWDFFKVFLPPKDIWDTKLKEIKQIRNRVAHFRQGHRDDLSRTLQLLRDLDKGFWHFCTGYNASSAVLPPSEDPVVMKFIELDQFPYQLVEENTWTRIGSADPNAWFNLTIDFIHRPWVTGEFAFPIEGKQGFLYDVNITGRDGRFFDYRRYFDDTKELHKHLVYIMPSAFSDSLRITIPAILGEDKIISIINELIRWLSNSFSSPMPKATEDQVKAFADEMPEYCLSPDNPLRFLDPSMPCSFFNV